MKKWICCAMSLLTVCAMAAAPDFETAQKEFRADHPRLFLTAETLEEMKAYAHGDGKNFLDAVKKRVASYPEEPKMEILHDVADLVDGKLHFKKHRSDQDNTSHALRCTGGPEAMDCALLYQLTGDRAAARKGAGYLKVVSDFIALADRSRILPDWYNYNRLSAITACDWLWDALTEEERNEFLGNMLRHVTHMCSRPGYHLNAGGIDQGNYGELALRWYIGVVAHKAGVDDEAAEKMLREGYDFMCRMMDFREKASGGKGILITICTQYSMNSYPYSGFLFLHSLRSFAGIKGEKYWKQPLEYPNFVCWFMIPTDKTGTRFRDFGWGDTPHVTNELLCKNVYGHMAQTLHFFGENKQARTVMALIPERWRRLDLETGLPFWPFLLTRFRPNTPEEDKILVQTQDQLAEFFPTFGMMIARSGKTENDTYFSCKTGAKLTGHQHYDENSFILYRKGFQALDTGMRASYVHHRAYYPQSVAHNTMLVRIPGQPLPKYWYPTNGPKFPAGLENDGGQNRMGVSKHLGFFSNQYYAATGGDAAQCYPKDTVKEATRIFVFVPPNHCVIYDRMEAVPEGKKVFLLHTRGEPTLKNGIWTSSAEEGKLFTRTLLPAKVKTEVIGGEGKEFWTNGVNYPTIPEIMKRRKGNTWLGDYRIEIAPEAEQPTLRMLHLLQTADADTPAMKDAKVIQTKTHDCVQFVTDDGADCLVTFARHGKAGGSIKLTKNGKILTRKPLWD